VLLWVIGIVAVTSRTERKICSFCYAIVMPNVFLSVVCSLFQGPKGLDCCPSTFLYQKSETSARDFFSLSTDYDEDYTNKSVVRRIDKEILC
jgi:hypothetical protein